MRQAFVPATGEAGGDNASKKRRRVGAAGEGQAVASIYESIVQPGTAEPHLQQYILCLYD